MKAQNARVHGEEQMMFTTQQVATLLGVSPSTIRKACSRGAIAGAVRVVGGSSTGWLWRIPEDTVKSLMRYKGRARQDKARGYSWPVRSDLNTSQLLEGIGRRIDTAYCVREVGVGSIILSDLRALYELCQQQRLILDDWGRCCKRTCPGVAEVVALVDTVDVAEIEGVQ